MNMTLACISVLLVMPCLLQAQENVSINLSCSEAFLLIQDHMEDTCFVILDLRPEEMYSKEHIENAIYFDVFSEEFDQWVSSQNKNATYLLYCNMGYRSGIAMGKMKQLGFKKLYHLHQGINEWKKQGYKTVSHYYVKLARDLT